MTLGTNFKEVDMYGCVEAFLGARGYEISAEVKRCDVVAIRGDTVVVVELKRSFGLHLVYQALRRQRVTPFVFVCIPMPKSLWGRPFSDMLGLVRQLGLGLLLVSMDSAVPGVSVAVQPSGFSFDGAIDGAAAPPRRTNKRIRAEVIREAKGRSMNMNKGGSVGGRHQTAYREQSIRIACALEVRGPQAPKALINEHACRQDTGRILSQNTYGWFDRISRGIYALSVQGQMFLDVEQQFRPLIDHYRQYYNPQSQHAQGKQQL